MPWVTSPWTRWMRIKAEQMSNGMMRNWRCILSSFLERSIKVRRGRMRQSNPDWMVLCECRWRKRSDSLLSYARCYRQGTTKRNRLFGVPSHETWTNAIHTSSVGDIKIPEQDSDYAIFWDCCSIWRLLQGPKRMHCTRFGSYGRRPVSWNRPV